MKMQSVHTHLSCDGIHIITAESLLGQQK